VVRGIVMIEKEGWYKDSNGETWYYNGWSNQPIATLINNKREVGFFRDGNSISSSELLVIVEYLPKEKYPEYYI
jgi:hypothetical protein